MAFAAIKEEREDDDDDDDGEAEKASVEDERGDAERFITRDNVDINDVGNALEYFFISQKGLLREIMLILMMSVML
ncbi:hypothetical protein QE152_g29986 [Popillia japonica]|uniref:Uncharacterized protein n=1 Tax=Popillia japonica TaxID=7064 RepID=A0AAW1JGG0_POPJA